MSIGERLRTTRERVGMTQQQLADRSGSHVVSVSNWGSEQPPLSTLAGRVRPVLRTVVRFREAFSTLYIIYASVKDESLDLLR